MKHNWEYKPFNLIADTITPRIKVEKSDYLQSGPIPIISQEESFISGYWNNPDDITPHSNDVVIFGDHSRVLKYVNCEFVVGADGVKIISPKMCIFPKFLYHFLKWYNVPSLGYARHFKLVKEAYYPVPPMEVQQQIVAELDKINEVIEDCRELLRNLDALAQSLFYDYFSDIHENVALSYYVNALVGGKSLAGKEFCINRVLKSSAVTYDYFDKDSTKFLPPDYIPTPEHLVKVGDVIISRMNTAELVGACAYVFDVDDNVFLPDRLWRIEYKTNANPIFLWKSLISESSKEQIRRKASGTSGSMKNISKPLLLSVQIKKVPLKLQENFAERIEQIDAQKKTVVGTIANLQTLLDSRMDYWFN